MVVPRAHWTWGVAGGCDTMTDRHVIGGIQSQYLGVCREGALRKTRVTMCNMFLFRHVACAQHVFMCVCVLLLFGLVQGLGTRSSPNRAGRCKEPRGHFLVGCFFYEEPTLLFLTYLPIQETVAGALPGRRQLAAPR